LYFSTKIRRRIKRVVGHSKTDRGFEDIDYVAIKDIPEFELFGRQWVDRQIVIILEKNK
jgi:hypothetical protein